MREYGGKCSKTAALVTALFLLACVLCSAVCIGLEAGHDCSGDDCPVCAILEECESNLRRLVVTVLAAVAVFFAFVLCSRALPVVSGDRVGSTPVSTKVRLNR